MNSTKVFYVISDAIRISGGAEKTASLLLRRLREHYEFECEMLSHHPIPHDEVRNGIRLRGFRDLEELTEITRAEKPDIIIGSLHDAVMAFKIGARFGIPCILSIHSYEYTPPNEQERCAWAIHPGFRPLPQADIDFVLETADHIFTCSEFMQQFLHNRSQVQSDVLPNAWDDQEILIQESSDRDGRFITAVCASPHKGIEIFLELARRFPSEEFMLAGAPGNEFPPKIIEDAVACQNVKLPGHMRPREFLAISKLVLVPSQFPEPFGRIAVEAMANRIPILASRTGGLCKVIGDGPSGVDEFTSIEVWEQRLRDQLDGQTIGSKQLDSAELRARAFLKAEPAHVVAKTIETLCAKSKPARDKKTVVFVGGIDGKESNTIVNGAWARELNSRGYTTDASLDTDLPADHVILHDYSKDFETFVPPETGHYIAVRTSDFGPYPQNWASKIEEEFDQLWVYTDWIAQQAQASGIDPDLIRVIPLGVDPELFRPDGAKSPYVPPDDFTFLFVGGAVLRKGIDTLIKAYQSTFSASDKVSLVIKGNSQNLHYQGFNEVEEILEDSDVNDPPNIIHIDDHLDHEDLAAIFRSCDVGVFPYRAEGFALPIAEAMASGTPAIVPNFGACLDFCTPETSFFVPARRIKLPYARTFRLAAGFVMEVQSVDFCEIGVKDLAARMREVYDAGRPALEEKRAAGFKLVKDRLHWANSVDHMEKYMRELKGTVPRRLVAKRDAMASKYTRETALRDLVTSAAVTRLHKDETF
jgi:glycosyltransferase involved in cell wall biosynthesis